MAGDNPFNAFLDPSKQGSISGMIGGLMGNPTASEAAGSATGQALSELSALKDQGLNNQQALLKFFQSPSGHDYFSNAGPDGLKQLADGLTATTAPSPTLTSLKAGEQLYGTSPGGGTNLLANNPQAFPNQVLGPQDKLVNGATTLNENTNQKGDVPADVRSFNYFTQIAQLPQAEITRLAGIKVDPALADKATAETQSIDKLVSDYGLDPRLGEALKAGQVKIVPMKNAQGQDTGVQAVVDLTGAKGPTVQIINPGNRAIPGQVPSTTPSNGAAVGAMPGVTPPVTPDGSTTPAEGPPAPQKTTTGNPAFGNKADMALGAGPVSKVLGAATKVSEAIDPKLIIDQGAQANDRETLLGTLRSNLQAIGTIGGGLSSNKGLIDGYVKTYLDEGFFSSPHAQVQKLIRLSEVADKNIADETERANDPNVPHEVQKQAYETVAAWQRVKASMPDYDTLIKQEAAIKSGTAGAPTVSGAVRAGVDAAGKALTEVKKQGTQIQTDTGLGQQGIDIDSINDPKALLAVDPSKLDRTGKIKLIRKIDAMTKGGRR